MSKTIWESPGGTFRLRDKREDLPRPLLELVATSEPSDRRSGEAIHLTPEDADDLWQRLTTWLHEVPAESWGEVKAGGHHGILDLISKERAHLEREFADRLSALTRREEAEAIACPFCGDNVDLHVRVSVGASHEVRKARRCQRAGCSCIVMGGPVESIVSESAGPGS